MFPADSVYVANAPTFNSLISTFESLLFQLGVPSKRIFGKSWAFGPTRGGGGLTEAQIFVEIFQKQICLTKWPEM